MLRTAVIGLFAAVLALGCGAPAPPEQPRPLVVVGIDGAEWHVIHELWDRGELPHLRALAERGATAELRTAYGESPVIWTTIATGYPPSVHGITGFVVPTETGDVPVSSETRRVPALWNVTSRAELPTAVLGWWASWPAEAIDGVVVSDRILWDLDRAVSPPTFEPRFRTLAEAALERPNRFGGNPAARDRDQVVAHVAAALAAEEHRLLMVYFRGVDIASHFYWKHYRPKDFEDVSPEEIARHGDEIPRVYRATDEAIGRILAAAPSDANVLVVSDHGFHPRRPEEIRVVIDFDEILRRLGFLRRRGEEIDIAASRVVTYATAAASPAKTLRLGGAADDLETLRRDLDEALATVTYEGGSPVFRLREPRPAEQRKGADLVADVLSEGATQRLRHGGDLWNGPVREIARISGSHGPHTHGIAIAAGPDFDPGADLEGIGIHDVAPTVLHALGLPVAEDMPGRPWLPLFTPAHRERYPVRTVASWASPTDGDAEPSAADQELLEELRSLGYID